MKFEWELISEQYDEYTHRAKIKGGWLVKVSEGYAVAITFIPDEHHAWVIEE